MNLYFQGKRSAILISVGNDPRMMTKKVVEGYENCWMSKKIKKVFSINESVPLKCDQTQAYRYVTVKVPPTVKLSIKELEVYAGWFYLSHHSSLALCYRAFEI